MPPTDHRRRTSPSWLLTLAAVAPVAAFAQSESAALRYDYLGAEFTIPELDELDLGLEGSIAVADKLVVFGRYLDYDPDDGIKVESLQIGVGRIFNLRRNIDFVASLSFSTNQVVEPDRPETEEEGVILGAQLRGWATPRIELYGTVMLDNSRGSSTDTVHELGIQYIRFRHLSLGGRIRTDEDESTVFLGARFYFGPSRTDPPLR